MSAVTLDTLDATRKLRDAGFDEKQAETVVRVLADAQSKTVTQDHLGAKFVRLQWMLNALLVMEVATFFKLYF